jgi:RNA polymerase sigma factor (sigma-70 family)
MDRKEVKLVRNHDPAISPATHSIPPSAPPSPAHPSEPGIDPLAWLASRIASFEEAAILEFQGRFEPQFRSLFLWKNVPESEAEDLACLCIEKAVLKIQQYQPREGKSFTHWVFRIAYNQLRDWARRQKTRPCADALLEEIPPERLVMPDPLDEDEGSGEAESPGEVTAAVNEALSHLSAKDQEVIRLRYFDQVSDNAQLAERLGIKVNAAKTRLSRANHRLKLLLEKDPRIKLPKH